MEAKVGWWLPMAGGRRNGKQSPMDSGVSSWGDVNILS